MSTIRKYNLFGFDFINAPNYRTILDEFNLGIKIESGEIPVMITPNVDQLVKYRRKKNKSIYDVLKHSKYILPDGQPIVSFSGWYRKKLQARLTGSDFYPLIWNLLKKKSSKIAYILPDEKLGKKLKEEYKDTFYYAPPFFDLKNKSEFEEVIKNSLKMISDNDIKFLFIGLGFPKQEFIATALSEKLKDRMPFAFLLGASFEFYLGMKKRAPKIYQKLGIEFLYRLLSEPRRMAKRYLADDLYFIIMIIKEFFKNEKK